MSVFTRLFNGQTTYDFMGTRKRWYIISAVMIAIRLISLVKPGLNAGVEFTGGNVFDFTAPSTSVARIDDVVQGAGVKNETPRVTARGDNVYRVETSSLEPATSDAVEAALKSELNATDVAV